MVSTYGFLIAIESTREVKKGDVEDMLGDGAIPDGIQTMDVEELGQLDVYPENTAKSDVKKEAE